MGSVQYWCSSGRAGGTDAGAMRKGRIQRPGFGFRGRRSGKQGCQGRLWQRSWDEEKRVWKDTWKRERTKHLIGARPALARRRGPRVSMQRGAIFGAVLVASQWKRREQSLVKRQQQDQRRMTNSAGWVQNRGLYRAAGRLAVQSYGWKGSRFWRRRLSFSASISQVLRFLL
jgi:hypothetical protein